jgi:hypothetical protein
MITNSYSLPITSDTMLVMIKLITINILILMMILVIGVGSISLITEIPDKLLLMLDSLIEKLPNTSMITNISYLNTSDFNLLTKLVKLTAGTVGSNKPLFA